MKLQPDSNQAKFTISAQGPGFVEINRVRHEHGICLGADVPPEPWGLAGFLNLTASDFARLAASAPEIIVIGTGNQQQFPETALLQPLMKCRIGFEIMNTAAACRTYNILAAEGRKVLAALLIEPPKAILDSDL